MADALIKVTATGPYVVTGGVPLTRRWQAETAAGEPMAWDPVGVDGYERETGETYALCRCGHSSNKPFCDGTHAGLEGFAPHLAASRAPGSERRATTAGEGASLSDDPTLCADAGFCGTALTNVWGMMSRSGDPEVRERAALMAANCPSGRLVLHDEAGVPIEPQFRPSIATIRNGPLWVRGGITVTDANGEAFEIRNRVTLCRCGDSQNKPFCDGAHKSHGFEAE